MGEDNFYRGKISQIKYIISYIILIYAINVPTYH